MESFKKNYGRFLFGCFVALLVFVVTGIHLYLLDFLPWIGIALFLLIVFEILVTGNKARWKVQRNWWLIGMIFFFAFIACCYSLEYLVWSQYLPWIAGAVRIFIPYRVVSFVNSLLEWD